jgi:hypothetical protein
MPAGTLDVINEWSLDRFGDPIVEDEADDLIVHADFVIGCPDGKLEPTDIRSPLIPAPDRPVAVEVAESEREEARAEGERLNAELDELRSALRVHQADLAALAGIAQEHQRLVGEHDETVKEGGRLRAEVERLETELRRRDQAYADLYSEHALERDALIAVHKADRARWESDLATRRALWELQRKKEAGELERRFGEQRQRLESELSRLREKYEATLRQAEDERESLGRELERLRNEARSLGVQAVLRDGVPLLDEVKARAAMPPSAPRQEYVENGPALWWNSMESWERSAWLARAGDYMTIRRPETITAIQRAIATGPPPYALSYGLKLIIDALYRAHFSGG